MNVLKVLLLSLLLTTTALAEVSVTTLGVSKHFSSKDFNSNNKLLAIEYRENNRSYAIGSYVNSYYKRATMVTMSQYIPWDTIQLSTVLSVNITTGYENTPTICIVEVGKLCTVLGIGIEATLYKTKPRLTLFGEALVFSVSYTF